MSYFKFKHFTLIQKDAALKFGTDAMLLGAFVSRRPYSQLLDVGTGTGAIALMCAQTKSEAKIDAIEIDEIAAKEAKNNFSNCSWSQRMQLLKGDFVQFKSDERYDVIVSNPPYYETKLENDDHRMARAKHVGELDANVFAGQVSSLLKETGECWIIVPTITSAIWIEQFSKFNLSPNHLISIKGKPNLEAKRMILGFAFNSISPIESVFTIRNTDNSYTNEYIELTKSFHATDLSK